MIIIWLHGLGASSEDLKPIEPYLKSHKEIKHIYLQAPNRPVTVNNGYHMAAWYDIYSFDRNTTKQDVEGVKESYLFLKDIIKKEIEAGADYKDIILAGFSQGGAVALYTALNHLPTLGGVIVLSSYLPINDTITKIEVDLNMPIFFAYGINDDVVIPEFSERSVEFLQEYNFSNITLKTYPMRHEICANELTDLNQWLSNIR